MRMPTKAAASLALAIAALATQAGAALADSRDVAASFAYRLQSQTWSQGNGTAALDFACNQSESYTVTLWSSGVFSDSPVGAYDDTCDGNSHHFSWGSLDSGNYYLVFTKGDDGVTVTGTGTISWPTQ